MIITPEGFLSIPITNAMIAIAKEKAEDMGTLKNSIRNGKGNIVGFIGEEVVKSAFTRMITDNTYQHDCRIGDTTFEIKTKDRTVSPKLSYEASVAGHNPNQRADAYIFVSLERDTNYHTGYICGYIAVADYYRNATFLTEGEVDPSNGWTVLTDCYNLPYAKLRRFHETIKSS